MDQIKQTSRGNLGEGFGEDYEVWLRTRQQIKPDDQLELTEAELIEDVVKVLDTENSTPAKNLVIFSFKESAFVPVRSYASKNQLLVPAFQNQYFIHCSASTSAEYRHTVKCRRYRTAHRKRRSADSNPRARNGYGWQFRLICSIFLSSENLSFDFHFVSFLDNQFNLYVFLMRWYFCQNRTEKNQNQFPINWIYYQKFWAKKLKVSRLLLNHQQRNAQVPTVLVQQAVKTAMLVKAKTLLVKKTSRNYFFLLGKNPFSLLAPLVLV